MIMTREQLNTDYKNACREEMKKDLIEEFEKVMNNDTISTKKKDWVLNGYGYVEVCTGSLICEEKRRLCNDDNKYYY